MRVPARVVLVCWWVGGELCGKFNFNFFVECLNKFLYIFKLKEIVRCQLQPQKFKLLRGNAKIFVAVLR
jgi:hypothetical protein